MAAASDLEGISNYLRLHHPALAAPTIFRIYDVAKSLKRLPNEDAQGGSTALANWCWLPCLTSFYIPSARIP
jgi:hypothetical protein